jgi:hypothetical protein
MEVVGIPTSILFGLIILMLDLEGIRKLLILVLSIFNCGGVARAFIVILYITLFPWHDESGVIGSIGFVVPRSAIAIQCVLHAPQEPMAFMFPGCTPMLIVKSLLRMRQRNVCVFEETR